jgi:uncharacterized protein DUF1206
MSSLIAARRETRQLEQVQPFQWLIRAGFVARAITYGVIGALALALALGAGTMGASPNQQGALSLIARHTLGRIAMVAICAGLLAYALWKLIQGIFGTGPEGGGSMKPLDRVGNFAGGIAYLVFFAVAVRILAGSSGNSDAQQKHAAAGVLGWPGGQVIVGVGGAVLIGVSLYQLYDALSGGFMDEAKMQKMSEPERHLFSVLGRVGLTARALVFALVGYFFVRTAIEFNPNDAVGVDGALAKVHHQALGPWILGLAAAGLIVFALYSLLEARYRRL